LLAALGTGNRDFDSLFDTGALGCRDRSQSLVLGLLAWLATLRFVLQTLVVKENLLANGPDELVVTIYANNRPILKLRRLFGT
jgi:hypothetical protein